RAAAHAFAREGHRAVVAGRHEEAGQELVTELRALGAEAEFIRTDVRREDEVRNLVDRTVARFGRLDVAVNNAGTEGQPGPVTQQTADTYVATFDTNVLGTLLSMKHELRVMQAQGSGSIVNISSTYGHEGGAGASVYAASKHAVEGMTKSAALEGALRGARQRCGPRSDRDRNAEPLHGNPGEEGGAGHGSATGARGRAGRDCLRHCVPCFRQGLIRDWPSPHRRRRQDRGLTAINRR